MLPQVCELHCKFTRSRVVRRRRNVYVYELKFNPDELVATFHAPTQTILTMGALV